MCPCVCLCDRRSLWLQVASCASRHITARHETRHDCSTRDLIRLIFTRSRIPTVGHDSNASSHVAALFFVSSLAIVSSHFFIFVGRKIIVVRADRHVWLIYFPSWSEFCIANEGHLSFYDYSDTKNRLRKYRSTWLSPSINETTKSKRCLVVNQLSFVCCRCWTSHLVWWRT